MVPSTIVCSTPIPLTPVGKLDRKALPEPEFRRAPRVPCRARTARADGRRGRSRRCSESTGSVRDDNFFDARRQLARRHPRGGPDQRGRSAPTSRVREIFEAPTVAALAARLDAHGAARRTGPPVTAGPRPTGSRCRWRSSGCGSSTGSTPRRPSTTSRWRCGSPATLDVDALRSAVADVVARHESLRTVYPDSVDGPYQVVLSAPADVRSSTSSTWRTSRNCESGSSRWRRPDSTSPPTCRCAPRCSARRPDDHVLVVVVHHIRADGFVDGPARPGPDRRLRRPRAGGGARAGRRCRCSTPTSPCGSGSCSAPRTTRSPRGAADSRTGRTRSADAPEVLDLPDRPCPARPSRSTRRVAGSSSRSTQDVHRSLNDARADPPGVAVHGGARRTRRAAGAAEQHRPTSPIGTPVAGRGERRSTTSSACSSTRSCCAPTSTRTPASARLLTQAREVDLNAFGNADVPFEQIVEVLRPSRTAAYAPARAGDAELQNLERPEARARRADGRGPRERTSPRARPISVSPSRNGSTRAPSRPACGAGSPTPPICSTSRRSAPSPIASSACSRPSRPTPTPSSVTSTS